MKKRVAGLLLALMMALSLVTPAVAVETENGVSAAAASPVVTWGELTKDAPDLKLPVSGQADQTVTNQEAVALPPPLGGDGRRASWEPIPGITTPWRTAWA